MARAPTKTRTRRAPTRRASTRSTKPRGKSPSQIHREQESARLKRQWEERYDVNKELSDELHRVIGLAAPGEPKKAFFQGMYRLHARGERLVENAEVKTRIAKLNVREARRIGDKVKEERYLNDFRGAAKEWNQINRSMRQISSVLGGDRARKLRENSRRSPSAAARVYLGRK